MHVDLLAKHTGAIPLLADWYLKEWEPYYGPHGPGDAKRDLASRCNGDRLPIGLIAIEEGDAVGTAALDLDPATNLTPSVVGLIVRCDRRNRGVATALLASAEETARRLGFDRLYLSTTVLGDWLTRIGWQAGAEVTFINGERGSVFAKTL